MMEVIRLVAPDSDGERILKRKEIVIDTLQLKAY
jgi:hypothetical protein